MSNTKTVKCKKCGFCFCLQKNFKVPDVECLTPSYCNKTEGKTAVDSTDKKMLEFCHE